MAYVLSSGKLDVTALSAELLTMFKALHAARGEFKTSDPLPALVRQAYLEAHGVAMEKLLT